MALGVRHARVLYGANRPRATALMPPQRRPGQRLDAAVRPDRERRAAAAANQSPHQSAPTRRPTRRPARRSDNAPSRPPGSTAISTRIDPHQRPRARPERRRTRPAPQRRWWRGRTASWHRRRVQLNGSNTNGSTLPPTNGRARPIMRLTMVTNRPGTPIARNRKPRRTATAASTRCANAASAGARQHRQRRRAERRAARGTSPTCRNR